MEIGTAKPWQRKVLLWIFAHSIVESESREGRAAAVRWKWSSSYLRVTDADYQRALTKDSALQKALQQPAVLRRTGSQPDDGRVGEQASHGFRLAGHAYLPPKGLKYSYIAKHDRDGRVIQGWSRGGTAEDALKDLVSRAGLERSHTN